MKILGGDKVITNPKHIEIIEHLKNGQTQAALAKRFGLSRSRIQQIAASVGIFPERFQKEEPELFLPEGIGAQAFVQWVSAVGPAEISRLAKVAQKNLESERRSRNHRRNLDNIEQLRKTLRIGKNRLAASLGYRGFDVVRWGREDTTTAGAFIRLTKLALGAGMPVLASCFLERAGLDITSLHELVQQFQLQIEGSQLQGESTPEEFWRQEHGELQTFERGTLFPGGTR